MLLCPLLFPIMRSGSATFVQATCLEVFCEDIVDLLGDGCAPMLDPLSVIKLMPPTRTHSVMVRLLLAGRRLAGSTPSRMARAALRWRT